MEFDGDRVADIWKETISLSWPIGIQQTLEPLMRTVDIIVTGLFSPAAVAAIGLAGLYSQFGLRVGQALGSGAIALASQDTGRGAETSREQSVSQAVLMGFLAGLPLVLVGVTASYALIAVLGAETAVVQLGGVYLTIILFAAPMRIVSLVGTKALQGTGDTITPMMVTVVGNLLNILVTIGLGLGLAGLPRLEIVGVGVGTAVGRTFEAVVITGAIAVGWTDLAFARPRDLTITRQLVGVALPNFAEGMSGSLTNFPFNAMLLLFGTEATAAYHISRRIYQQFMGPMYRSYRVAASVIIGQALGEGDPERARFSGISVAALGVVSLGVAGAALFAAAGTVVGIFTAEPTTFGYAVQFTRVFGISMVFFGVYSPIAGALRGASDTRTPFYARLSGSILFMLGFAYLTSVTLGFGLIGVFAGLFLSYVWRALVALVVFLEGDWAGRAASMMAERAAGQD